jgi:hypothetical protein
LTSQLEQSSGFNITLIACGAGMFFASSLATAQAKVEIYQPFEANHIALVGFSELLAHSRELDTRQIQISGYCARLSYGASETFVFSSKDNADHLNMRESVALKYEGQGTNSRALDEADYRVSVTKLNNHNCRVTGRYSTKSVFVLGSDVDRGIPSNGTLYVLGIDGGMAREDTK